MQLGSEGMNFHTATHAFLISSAQYEEGRLGLEFLSRGTSHTEGLETWIAFYAEPEAKSWEGETGRNGLERVALLS